MTGVSPVRVEQDVVRDGALMRFEIFLFSSIGTVLVTRGLLAATGYPKVGSGELHIAHVLWGGLLLGAAVVMLLVGMGTRVRTWAALVAGIGFGLFIDEVGKFLTKDVNYFYRPAVAVMYVVFVAAFLLVRWLVLRRPLSDSRRVAVAGVAITDQALGQLDRTRRDTVLATLQDLRRPTVTSDLIGSALTSATVTNGSWRAGVSRRQAGIVRGWTRMIAHPVLQVALWLLVAVGVGYRLYTYLDYLQVVIELERLNNDLNALGDGGASGQLGFGFYFWYLLIANLVCAAIVAMSLIVVLIPRFRQIGLWALQWGLILDLLFNQFSTFKTDQFRALSGFLVEVVVILVVRQLMREHSHNRWSAAGTQGALGPVPVETDGY